ncbi:hypothetical protein PAPYR_8131 [Paratrimastix pyriformis]|uniref:Uncharacterized protein n=1 Tax=Paratrimastix pyriformis TaxID=342808 RepID=A0ABQ8UB89_9EUKA|nr:hypothetical protein PAPYR_8131 [Paratrimastix pyriformis]
MQRRAAVSSVSSHSKAQNHAIRRTTPSKKTFIWLGLLFMGLLGVVISVSYVFPLFSHKATVHQAAQQPNQPSTIPTPPAQPAARQPDHPDRTPKPRKAISRPSISPSKRDKLRDDFEHAFVVVYERAVLRRDKAYLLDQVRDSWEVMRAERIRQELDHPGDQPRSREQIAHEVDREHALYLRWLDEPENYVDGARGLLGESTWNAMQTAWNKERQHEL